MSKSEKHKRYLVTVTQLKISKPFLKVHVKNNTEYSNERAKELKEMFELELETFVAVGGSYIANVTKDRYERCRVIQVNGIEGTATLMFVDCGYQGELPTSRLRPLRDRQLAEDAPFCQEFILAEITLVPNTPHNKILNFHEMIVDNTFEMTILKENEAGKFVDLRLGGHSLSNVLIIEHPELSSMLKKCPIDEQMSLMLQMKRDKEKFLNEQGMKPISFLESPEAERRSPAAEFSRDSQSQLESDEHFVRVTEFDDEPFCFFVQFVNSDNDLMQFQWDLQRLKGQLKSEKRVPLAGSTVIADFAGNLHRATVMPSTGALARDEVKLQLMETGQKCVVVGKQLYKAPYEVLIVPPYAKRFKLQVSDEDGERLLREIECCFKLFTKDKILTLQMVPVKTNLLVNVPSCHLVLDGANVLDICKRSRLPEFESAGSMRGGIFSPHTWSPTNSYANSYGYSFADPCTFSSPNSLENPDGSDHSSF